MLPARDVAECAVCGVAALPEDLRKLARFISFERELPLLSLNRQAPLCMVCGAEFSGSLQRAVNEMWGLNHPTGIGRVVSTPHADLGGRMTNEEQERAATQFHAWMADRAEEIGAVWMSTTYAWTGEFREDGVLVPADKLGFSAIPPFRVGAAVADALEGFAVQHLYYSAPVDRYAVVETVWAEEIEPPGAFPIGKPAPEGSAPCAG